jgi:hypothetical protein
MTKIKKQQAKVAELLELIKQNPTLRIMPMVETEVVASDDYGWWMAEWGKASVEEVYLDDERIYIRSLDEDILLDRVADHLSWIEKMEDEESFRKAEEEIKNYKWEKVIAVKITI